MLDFFDYAYISVANKLTTLAFTDINVYEIESGSGNGVFSKVDNAVKSTGQGLYHTLLLIGGFGAVIFLIIAFIYYGVSGSGNNKEQAKSRIFTVLIATAGIFAAVAIVALMQTIGTGIKTEIK